MKKLHLMSLALAGALVAWSGPAAAKCSDGKDRRVKIINDTSFTLRQLYGSNVGSDKWEEDVLGNDTIQPGGSWTVNFDDGSCYCYFDFKAVFSDNTSTVRRRYNVCTSTEWRIYE